MQLDSTLGVTRLGHYRLVRRLAVGGMAELFVAVAEGAGAFQKPVAIKRILPRLAREPHFVEMFFAEAELAASLDHPHIAKVLDFGEQDDLPYLVMEFVHGVDLADLLRAAGGPLPTEQAATLAVQVAEALHHVHEHRDLETAKPLGLVHRDVSPSNVLVGYTGGAKLTDFGIVKATSTTQYTATGALKGKLSYLSPEQARCERIDRRTDVYALGLVLFELFTGRRMHRAMSEVALLARVCEGTFTPPSEVHPDIDADIERIIARALMPDRELRYATAREVARAFETLATRRGWSLSMAGLSEYVDSKVPNPGPITIERSGVVAPNPDDRPVTRFIKQRGRTLAAVSALIGLGIGVGVGPSIARSVAETPQAEAPPLEPATRPTEEPEPQVTPEPQVAPKPEAEVVTPQPRAAETTPAQAEPPTPRKRRKRKKSRPKATKGLDSSLLPPSQRGG